MRILLTLLGKDFAILRRNRGALILSLVVPIVLIYIVGQVFGLNRKQGGAGPTGIRLAVVNASNHTAATKLVDALKAEPTFRIVTDYVNADQSTRPLAVADLRPLIRDRKLRYALVLPPDLIATDRIGLNLEIYSDPQNQIETQMVNGILQKTIFSSVPQLLGEALKSRAKQSIGDENFAQFNRSIANTVADSFGGDREEIFRRMQSGAFGVDELAPEKAATPEKPVPADLRRLDTTPSAATTANASTASKPADDSVKPAANILSNLVRIKSEQVVGKEVKSPEATRVVGGYAVMFLLFALSASSAAFFDEKRSGMFQRLLSTPVRRSQLLWSRFLYGILFGVMQLTLLFFAGSFLYGIEVISHLGNLLVVCAATAAACTAFGMLLAAITRSQQAASSLGNLIVLTMSACGGAWFPISFLPEFMQQLSRFTIVYWALDGFSQVLWAGNSFVQILPTVGVLLAISGAVMAVAVWRFNRSKLFE
ncbi:MAG: ABC transporter permease [Opitutaceae bacterium]